MLKRPETRDLRMAPPSKGECSAPRCDQPAKTAGFCTMHYKRQLRHHGDLDVTRPRRPDGTRQAQVLACIEAHGGIIKATAEHGSPSAVVQRETGLSASAVGQACTDLELSGLIGRERNGPPGSQGRFVAVWLSAFGGGSHVHRCSCGATWDEYADD